MKIMGHLHYASITEQRILYSDSTLGFYVLGSYPVLILARPLTIQKEVRCGFSKSFQTYGGKMSYATTATFQTISSLILTNHRHYVI
jgi:hypothetical protein